MDQEKHPIAAGLIALVAVALAVGLVLGIVAFAATKLLGIGGQSEADSSAHASLYLPSPSITDTPTGAQVTLLPDPDSSSSASPSGSASDEPSDKKSGKDAKKDDQKKSAITLQAAKPSVSPGERIDLSGVYPQGEGKILKVERKIGGGSWEDFPVQPLAVSGGQFSTYVLTDRVGTQSFRMVETENAKHVSNVVKVKVG